MSQLIYVHGTNGSGKSTLARELLKLAGGPMGVLSNSDNKRATTLTAKSNFVLLGKYKTACGGIDGIQPYFDAVDELELRAHDGKDVFAEGLVTPGLETCKRISGFFGDKATFILLDTPIDKCIEHVKIRRIAAENHWPLDTSNLLKKHKTAQSWANRCQAAGLRVVRLQFDAALECCKGIFGL